MANDPRKPKTWMNPAAGASKAPPASQKRGWHPATSTAKAEGGRRRSLLLPAVAGAVLLGVLVAVILLIRGYPPTRMIVIGPSEAKTLAIPQNVGGAKSARAVADWANGGRSRPRLAREPNDSIKIEDWAEGLDGREEVAVVYFCLHGGSDAKGPYLWLVPPEATFPSEQYKLRLSAVLDRLAQLPEKKKKLLVLDVTQVDANFPLGQLHNDFVRELKTKKLDDQIEKIQNLVVISASDIDQKSWYSEEWQETIFTHYFVEGARGAADSNRVSVESLFNYLAKRVPAWVRSNRGEDQSPILLPSKTGMERARNIELATISGSYKPAEAAKAPGALLDVPDELTRAWERRDTHDQMTPRPEAVSPYQNRRYLDSLLRIESMLRAGMSKAEVQDRLGRLAKDESILTRSPWKMLSSIANALPMPAALGSPYKSTLDSGRFQSLWRDPANEWPKLQSSVESQGESAVMFLRFEVCSQLLDFLISDDRPENLAIADALLKRVFRSASAPTEAHVLLIFQRDLDAKAMPDWPTLKLALQMHRLAEQIALVGGAGPGEYPASELVFPWIRDAVTKADTERLRGEDLLISNIPADWPKANALLQTAKQQYEAIGKQAGQIRQALAARNQALAELPYFARWVAGLSNEFENDPEKPRKLLELVEKTAEGMHQLASILEVADPSRLPELNSTAHGVRAGLDELRNVFFLELLPKLTAETQVSKWRHIDNALQVPFIPAQRRKQLLLNLRSISQALNAKFENVGTVPPPANSADRALELTQRQGRIALALLGSAWINDPVMRDESGGAAKLKFEDLKQKVNSPVGSWWESLNQAGEQIGWHWRALAGQVDSLTDKANRGALAPAMKQLARADYLARLADSATDLGKDRDPVVDYRRHCLHRFLLDQAQRSINANWDTTEAGAKQSNKPSYAEFTAARFVKDAEDLILMGADKNPTPEDRSRLLAEVHPMQAALKIENYAVSPDEPSIELTDRKDFRVRFKITPPSGQPAGYPVLRFHTSGPCKLSAEATRWRKPIKDFADFGKTNREEIQDAEVDLTAVSKAPGVIAAELWYRGHRIVGNSTVTPNREPSSIWVHKPPRGDGGFVVRAGPEFRKGAVAIVLDWSYSMVNAGKYTQAVDALETVLNSLPPGTTVSLLLFGSNASSPNEHPYKQPKEYDPERRPEQLAKLIKELRLNPPRGKDSPIASAICRMAEEGVGFPRDFPGVKTMLVLTDGQDNVDGDEAGNVVHRRLTSMNIALKMCFFQAVGNEESIARAQFKRIEDLDTPGEFYSAKQKGELISKLIDAMTPRVSVHHPDGALVRNIEGRDRRGVRVSIHGDRLDAFARVPKGAYDLVEKNSRTGRMVLEPGDRLLLELERVGRQALFRPADYIPLIRADDGLKLVGKSKGDKPITGMIADAHLVPHPGSNRDYDLDMLVLMESAHSPDLLKVTRPQFAWIETRTQNENQGPNALLARIETQNYLPCPAWRVRVWNWPALPGQDNTLLAPSRPLVSLWWSDALPSDPSVLKRESGKSLAECFDKKSFNRDEKNIRIENARYENNYLVVELSYPPGPPPVFVRTEGLQDSPRLTLEEEHRFYDKAGKYTARFGPIEESRQGQAFQLLFYSMAALQKSAARIDLRPNLSPTSDPPLGQTTPRPD